jgi:hypothetical protein
MYETSKFLCPVKSTSISPQQPPQFLLNYINLYSFAIA